MNKVEEAALREEIKLLQADNKKLRKVLYQVAVILESV